MPSNLYESKNEFRLYDVEGVILSPNEYILINEPEGFRDFNITIERDPDKHGLFYEFGGDDELLGFDRVTLSDQSYSPYEFINTILDSKGIDSKIQLEFLSDDISQYKADFDFESLNIEDYKISVNVRRVLLGDLFRTRIETPVDFSKTESIDGDTITGLSSETMFLHSKPIFNKCITRQPELVTDSAFIREFPTFFGITRTSSGGSQTIQLISPNYSDFNNIKFSDGSVGFIPEVKSLVPELAPRNGEWDVLGYYFLPAVSESYKATFDIVINGRLSSVSNNSSDGSIFLDVFLFREYVDFNGDSQEEEYLIGQTSFVCDGNSKEQDFNFDINFNFNFNDNSFGSNYRIKTRNNNINTFPTDGSGFAISYRQIDFNLNLEIIEENSNCDVYKIKDSTNHILESITNNTSVLESSFLSNEANNIYQTNGYSIRQFIASDSNVNTSQKQDFKTQFDKFLQPLFGLGYSIYEKQGQFKMLIERYSEFYQDLEIEYIDSIQDSTYFIEYDKDVIFNEIKVGYKDFPKSTDENTSNNLDEFNTEHNYLTPIESVKNKKEYISEAIASGYKIENQRREQFKDVPTDTVSDDEKVFVINGLFSDSYDSVSVSFFSTVSNQIKIFATYLDIQVGDILTFPDSQNTGSYTVESLSILGDELIIIVTESFTVEIVNTRIVRNTTRLRALRDEEFDFATNIIDPETSYNIGLNPRYMLKNQSLILNSGFNPKPINSEIKAQEIKLNDKFTCKFKSGEGDYNLDNQTTVTMGENQPLNTFNNYQKLFTGFLIKFTANINYQRLLSIRNDYLNQGSNNFGYIRIKTPLGTEKKGFLMSMNYNPLSEQAEFVLREKFE